VRWWSCWIDRTIFAYPLLRNKHLMPHEQVSTYAMDMHLARTMFRRNYRRRFSSKIGKSVTIKTEYLSPFRFSSKKTGPTIWLSIMPNIDFLNGLMIYFCQPVRINLCPITRVPSINRSITFKCTFVRKIKFSSGNHVVVVLCNCKMQVSVENCYNSTLDEQTFCKRKTCYFLKCAKQCHD